MNTYYEIAIVLLFFAALIGTPSFIYFLVRAIRLKILGIGFRWQLRMLWDRVYAKADWSYGIRTAGTKIKLKMQENYIPKDEFDHSLDMDLSVLEKLNDTDRDKYLNNLVRRRQAAHDQEWLREMEEFREKKDAKENS